MADGYTLYSSIQKLRRVSILYRLKNSDRKKYENRDIFQNDM